MIIMLLVLVLVITVVALYSALCSRDQWKEATIRWRDANTELQKSYESVVRQKTIEKLIPQFITKEVIKEVEVPAEPEGELCPNCTSGRMTNFCNRCGHPNPEGSIVSIDVPWETVNTHLFGTGQWGKAVNTAIMDNDRIFLPWARSRGAEEFTVGNVRYTWSRDEPNRDYDTEDQDDPGSTRWRSVLEWEDPVIGTMRLINRVGASSHMLELDDVQDANDEAEFYVLTNGVTTSLPYDVLHCLRDGLNDFYLWDNPRATAPEGVHPPVPADPLPLKAEEKQEDSDLEFQ